KSSSWTVEVTPTSKYNADGTPISFSSQVKIEMKPRSGSTKISQIQISKYPNEGGLLYVDLGNIETPLFILVAKGGNLAEHQRELILLSPSCKSPLATVAAEIEEANQIEVNTGVKDFMISFPGPKGQVKKT